MSEPYEIFIPCAPKDFNKLKFLIASLRQNLGGWTCLRLCVPRGSIVPNDVMDSFESIHFDSDILDVDLGRIKHRPNWQMQQMLKLFQDVTEHDLFMTIDSDVIINRPLPMFEEDGRRIIWMGHEQNHRPYFEFQERMLGLPRVYPHTFISDTNFFSKKLISEMLAGSGYTIESFIEKSFSVIGPDCYMGEPEIWGQYVHKHHPEKYSFREAAQRTFAKETTGKPFEFQAWSDTEIQNKIQEMANTDVDLFALHSWWRPAA